MALNSNLANQGANAAADAATALMTGGFLRIYAGVQPEHADIPVTTQALLAQLTLGMPAFQAAINGVAQANPITPETSARQSGIASWFRIVRADLSTVCDGSVGALTGFDLNLTATAIVQHGTVAVTSFTYTQSKTSER